MSTSNEMLAMKQWADARIEHLQLVVEREYTMPLLRMIANRWMADLRYDWLIQQRMSDDGCPNGPVAHDSVPPHFF